MMYKNVWLVFLAAMIIGCEGNDSRTSYQDDIPHPGEFRSLRSALVAEDYVRTLIIEDDISLTFLPSNIDVMVNLERLTIRRTRLRSLPPEIGSFSKLYLLFLYNNVIDSLPKQIGKLQKLEQLDLSGNQIHVLPDEIGGITSLKYLWLNDNYLDSLPSSFKSLKNLTRLGVSGNKMSPEYIEKIKTWFPNATFY